MGRPKGALNKTSASVKDAICAAFTKMGGVKALVEWAERSDANRAIFYEKIWLKVMPQQIETILTTVTVPHIDDPDVLNAALALDRTIDAVQDPDPTGSGPVEVPAVPVERDAPPDPAATDGTGDGSAPSA